MLISGVKRVVASGKKEHQTITAETVFLSVFDLVTAVRARMDQDCV
jgi:hypothetical protein